MAQRSGETYLHDGCYVSYDGEQFCLRAQREYGVDHFIFLEARTLELFLEFVKQQTRKGRPR
jgi:hypothetical protein